jgi:hypothetical protein
MGVPAGKQRANKVSRAIFALQSGNIGLLLKKIRILQDFATELWNITKFVMLFQAVMKFLSRSTF